MVTTIRTFEETTSGAREAGPDLWFITTVASVRELIAAKVRATVEAENTKRAGIRTESFPADSPEKRFNRPAERGPKPVGEEGQVEKALQAFERGTLIVLLPDGQADSLDEIVDLSPIDEVTFLRLVPLVGG